MTPQKQQRQRQQLIRDYCDCEDSKECGCGKQSPHCEYCGKNLLNNAPEGSGEE